MIKNSLLKCLEQRTYLCKCGKTGVKVLGALKSKEPPVELGHNCKNCGDTKMIDMTLFNIID